MMARAQRIRADGGAATVEFALVFPILAAIVGLIMFAGWLGVMKGILDHGAREAARYVSIPCSSDLRTYPDDPRTSAGPDGAAPDPATDPCPGSADVAAVLERSTPMVSIDPANVGVTGAGGTNAPVTVTVSYEAPNPFGWLVAPLTALGVTHAPGPITLSATAEMRRE